MNQTVNQSKGFSLAVMFHRSKGVCLLSALFLAFVFSLLGSGCSSNPDVSPIDGKTKGNLISFSVISGGGSSSKSQVGSPYIVSSKTLYSGQKDGNVERIYWSNGDRILISCAQALASYGKSAEYDLIVPSSELSTSKINAVSGNGLWWGSGEHSLFGLYPAPSKSSESISLSEGGVISAKILSTQPLTADGTAPTDAKKFLPDMRYAYMWSGVKAAANASSVEMRFYPGFNAYQFTVNGATTEDITITGCTLSSTSCALSGEYGITITANSNSASSTVAYSVPSVATSGSSKNSEVVFTFPSSISVSDSKSVTFTLFTLPARLNTESSTIENKITDVKIKFDMIYKSAPISRSLILKYSKTHSDASKRGKVIDFASGSKSNLSFSLPDFKNMTITIFEIADFLDSTSGDKITITESNLDIEVFDEDEDDGGILGDPV